MARMSSIPGDERGRDARLRSVDFDTAVRLGKRIQAVLITSYVGSVP